MPDVDPPDVSPARLLERAHAIAAGPSAGADRAIAFALVAVGAALLRIESHLANLVDLAGGDT